MWKPAKISKMTLIFKDHLSVYVTGADPETLLMEGGGGGGGGGVVSYGAIIDGTNCSPKAVLACRSVNLVFISIIVQ